MEWLPTDNNFFKKCSNCGALWDTEFCQNIFVNYCPKCVEKQIPKNVLIALGLV